MDAVTIEGNGAAALNLNGAATFTAENFIYGITINANGTTTLNGSMNLGENAVFNNLSGATLNISDGGGLGGETCVINNSGTININAASAGAGVDGTIYDSGTINVNTGFLAISAGGGSTLSGKLNVASDAFLELPSSLIIDAASVISGAGDVYFYNASNVVNGTYDVSGNTDISGVAVYFDQSTNSPVIMGSLSVDEGATVAFASPLQVSGATDVNAKDALLMFGAGTALSSLKLAAGTIDGAGTVTVSNTFEWDSGTISGLTVNATGGVISTNASTTTRVLNGTINCYGSIESFNMNFGANAALNIMPGATLETSGFYVTGSDVNGQLQGTLSNYGTVIIDPDANVNVSGSNFENRGEIEIGSGGFLIATFSQDGGSMTLSNGTINGTFIFNEGQVTGNGSFSGVITNNGLIAPSGGMISVDNGCSLNLGSSSILSFSLGGTQAGVSYGQIMNLSTTNGNITLGGTLQVMFTGGFQNRIASSDVFTLITGTASLNGHLANAQNGQRMLTADGVGSFLVSSQGGTVTLSDYQVTPYGTWQMNTFSAQDLSNPAKSGAGAMPQNDGVPNLLKYLYGIDPTVHLQTADRATLPAVQLTNVGSLRCLTMTYHQSPLATGITIQAQVSTDLLNWQTIASAQIGTDANGNAVWKLKPKPREPVNSCG